MSLIELASSTTEAKKFEPKCMTPLGTLRSRGSQLVGVVPVIAHEGEAGVEILIARHKATLNAREGQIGIPRETVKWDEKTTQGETLERNTWRCFWEELGGIDISRVPFLYNPDEEKYYHEMTKILNNGLVATGRVVVLWTPTTEWVPTHPQSRELDSTRFVTAEMLVENPFGWDLREFTADVVEYLAPAGALIPQNLQPISITPRGPVYDTDFRYTH